MDIMYLIIESYCETDDTTNTSKSFKIMKKFFEHDYWSILLLSIFFIICCNPFKWFHRTARKELAMVIWNIFIAPFGTVRFKDFFFADILTSIGGPLIDMGLIATYFGNDKYWYRRNVIKKGDHPDFQIYAIIISFAPFWWRFWQCINKARTNPK